MAAGCGDGGLGEESQDAPERWGFGEPTVRIGSVDGPATALTDVRDVAVGPDGAVYVLQRRDPGVRVFGPDGTPLRTIGREGEGPGEMLLPATLGFLSDTLWVADLRLRRVGLYSPAGEALGELGYPSPPDVGDGVSATFEALLADGLVLFLSRPAFRSELGGTRHPFPVLVRPRTAGPVDTLAFRDRAHVRVTLLQGTPENITSVMIVSQPLSDATLLARSPDGASLVLVDRSISGDGSEPTYGVTRVEIHGDTVFSVKVPYEPRPLPADRVDSIVASLGERGASPSVIRDSLFLPGHHPPASDVVAGEDAVWVAREEVPGELRTWEVFNREGRRVARLEAPPRLRILRVEDEAVWGVETDEMDVPYVVRYPVLGGAPTT